MMKKALWALALLFLVSGCDDNENGPSSPRPDKRVTTTFNFEYNLNYATATTPPASYSQVPVMPSSLVSFRVVMELYQVTEVPPVDPDPNPTYKYTFYDRVEFFTNRHKLSGDGNLLLSGDVKLDKYKYKAIVWGDYVETRDSLDRNFVTDHYLYGDDATRGLRYISETDPTLANSSFINEGGLRGIKEFDLTIYENDPISSETVDVSLSRSIGGIFIVANDLAAYKALAPSESYYNENYRPARATANFGTYEQQTAPYSGYPSIYNAFDNKVISFTNDLEKKYAIGSPISDDQLVIANFFLFADAEKTEQDDMTVTVYGPKNGVITKFEISNLPLEPNKLLYVEAPLLTGESIYDDTYSIRILDRFDDIYTPTYPDPEP